MHQYDGMFSVYYTVRLLPRRRDTMSKKYERKDWVGNKYWENEHGNREYEREDWAGNKYREDKDGNKTYEREDWAGNKYKEDSEGKREYERTDWAGNKYREDEDGNRTYVREDWAGNTYEEKDDKKGGCFLTTACVEHRGLADNCRELERLREFRDTYVRFIDGGPSLLQEYYLQAPLILSKLRASESRDAELAMVYDSIKMAVHFIDAGRTEEALQCYVKMYAALKQKYQA
jgi:hypothetical protein